MNRTLYPICALALLAPIASAQDETSTAELVAQAQAEQEAKWESQIRLGLNGSRGNTDSEDLYAVFTTKRETTKTAFNFLADYKLGRENDESTENRLLLQARNDWFINESPWSVFVLGEVEFDEFEDWYARLVGTVGLGYQFIKNDVTTLNGRIGFGGSYEVDGDPEEFTPEAYLGADWSHKLTEKQSLTASVDYFPSLEDSADYRIIGRAGYQVLLDEETSMSLILGVEDRYDSTAEDDKNNIDYFLQLGWSF